MAGFVPGHGRSRFGDDAQGHLELVRGLFEHIVAQVDNAVGSGVSLEDLQESIDWSSFRRDLAGDDPVAARAFDQFVPATLEREYQRRTSR